MAMLRCAAKYDLFLSLDCASAPSTLAQSKERKGSNFAIWQPCLQGLPTAANAAVMNPGALPVVANGGGPGGGPVGGMGHIQTIVGGPALPPAAVTGLNPDENYCLRWNEYEKKYAETFRCVRATLERGE